MNNLGANTSHIFLDDLRKSFGAVNAVGGVTLAIEAGEFFSLLGPSGCGKTTLMRMIAGLEEPTSGRVLIDGRDITDMPSARRPVNMVFQAYALFPHMSVWENVAFGLKVAKEPRDEIATRVAEALRTVRLEGYDTRRPNQLSGGQQQRVALARALVNRPEALLLDEPLGALDLKLRREMQRELKQLQVETGTTFIYVTHDQEEALTMSDRIAVMDGGRVEQVATPRELYERPATPFVAGFIGVSNVLHIEPGRRENGHAVMDLGADERIVVPVGDAPSGPLRITVRPEKVKFGEAATPGSRVTGTVEETVYLGSITQFAVVLSTGERLVVHRLNDELGGERYRAGDRVVLTWAAEHSVEIAP